MRFVRTHIWVFVCLCLFTHTHHANANNLPESLSKEKTFEILYYEPLPPMALISREQNSPDPNQSAPSWNWSFEAFGKTFHVILQGNNRLIIKLPKNQREKIASTYALYRGNLHGNSDSWVRLTQIRGQWSGMIWDGEEIYIIDAMHVLAPSLQTTPSSKRNEHGIYRLSDTRDLGNASCGLGDPGVPNKPINDYKALLQELREFVPAQAEGASFNLNMAVVADVQFSQIQQNNFGTPADAAVIARMNVVDGIFSEQVGVQISLVEIRELAQNGSLTSTSASTLLNQFGEFTSSASFTHPGIAHLFTGRELNGSTIGIAFLSSLCSSRFGVGVNEIQSGGTAGALVVAHELGHNFGAPHDNQGGSACSSTPGTFLMNPSINGSDQFSQCSLDQIQPVVAAASCITVIDLTRTDVRVSIPMNPVTAPVGLPFNYTVEVQNTGTLTANNVNAVINVPTVLTINSATVNNQSCSVNGSGEVTCDLGNIPSGEDRIITLNLQGQSAGQLTVNAEITADNDQNSQNNNTQGTIDLIISGPTVRITSPADGSVLSNESAVAFVGDASDGEDGDLSNSIVWTSDIDGTLGTGSTVSATLSEGSHRITASATDQDGNTTTEVIMVTVIDGDIGTILFQSDFDTDSDGFTYIDDTFRSTNQPNFADGTHESDQGFSGGGLRVQLGGINNTDIFNMSGGWTRTFTVPSDGQVILAFRYRLTQTSEYESDELSEALLSVDGNLVGIDTNEFLAQIVGNGNGGTAQTTGWIPVGLSLGSLSAGEHTITIGGFNNKKTFNNESTEVMIDDVVVRHGAASPPPPPNKIVLQASFNNGAQGFVFRKDTFRNTNQPNFVSGSHQPNQGFTGGALEVLLGGINNANILNMSGGWRRYFTLPTARQVTVSFRYKLTQASNYENDEFSEMLLAIDDQLLNNGVLARVTGNGNGGADQTTGWVSASINVGMLSEGPHTILIGGFNNKKTFNDEVTQILIDDVVVR